MESWLNNNLGKGAKGNPLNPYPPHSIPGECVTAASSWSMAQGGPELLGATAYSIWQNFQNSFYTRVSSNFVSGDILFYSPNDPRIGTGPDGHVDNYIGNNQTAGMDWNGNPNLQIVDNISQYAIGAFRPNNQGEIMTPQVVDSMFRMGFRRDPNPQERSGWTGRSVGELLNAEMTNPEWLQGAGLAGISQEVCDSLVRGILGTNPTSDDYNKYVGQTLDFVLSDLISRKA